MRSTVLLVLLLCCISHADATDALIPKTIDSRILNEQRQAVVQLPKSYHDGPEQHDPVLYVLDGKANLAMAASLLERMYLSKAVCWYCIVSSHALTSSRPTWPLAPQYGGANARR